MNLGQRRQALEQVDSYLAGHAADPQGYFLKGVTLSEMGRTSEAITVFLKMTEDFPALAEPYNNLAALYAKDHQLDKAREALLSALKARPDYGVGYQNLGDVYAAMARQAYERANELGVARGVTATAPVAVASAAATTTVKSSAMQLPPTRDAMADQKSAAQALSAWAAAWSRQDVDQYLNLYGKDFRPANGLTRSAWEAQRRQRLHKPEGIEIRIDREKWTALGAGRWKVVFSLQYNSGKLKVRSTKAIVWSLQEGRWMIESESAG